MNATIETSKISIVVYNGNEITERDYNMLSTLKEISSFSDNEDDDTFIVETNILNLLIDTLDKDTNSELAIDLVCLLERIDPEAGYIMFVNSGTLEELIDKYGNKENTPS